MISVKELYKLDDAINTLDKIIANALNYMNNNNTKVYQILTDITLYRLGDKNYYFKTNIFNHKKFKKLIRSSKYFDYFLHN